MKCPLCSKECIRFIRSDKRPNYRCSTTVTIPDSLENPSDPVEVSYFITDKNFSHFFNYHVISNTGECYIIEVMTVDKFLVENYYCKNNPYSIIRSMLSKSSFIDTIDFVDVAKINSIIYPAPEKELIERIKLLILLS